MVFVEEAVKRCAYTMFPAALIGHYIPPNDNPICLWGRILSERRDSHGEFRLLDYGGFLAYGLDD
jgi:hypothetical protein